MALSKKYEALYEAAVQASKNAYAEYSHFHVGAALQLASGEIITGVNIENRSYGATVCAERTAFFKAVSMGHRDFAALAVATPDADYPVSPCGMCRQVISEFTASDFPVIFGSCETDVVETTIGDLYPYDALHELRG